MTPTTRAACATVTGGTSSAPGGPATGTAATLTSRRDNAVENANVCEGAVRLPPLFFWFVCFFFRPPRLIQTHLHSPGCFYNGAVLGSGQSIPDPGNLCSECTCQVARRRTREPLRQAAAFSQRLVLHPPPTHPTPQSGSVRCSRTPCRPPLCSHPVTNACGCPVCDGKRLALLRRRKQKGGKK